MADVTPRPNTLHLTDLELKKLLLMVGYALDNARLDEDETCMAVYWIASDAVNRYYEREGITD